MDIDTISEISLPRQTKTRSPKKLTMLRAVRTISVRHYQQPRNHRQQQLKRLVHASTDDHVPQRRQPQNQQQQPPSHRPKRRRHLSLIAGGRPSKNRYTYYDEEDANAASRPPLIQFENAVLCYPAMNDADTTTATTIRDDRHRYAKPIGMTPPINLTIDPPDQGGHVILGPNASGKTLLSNVLQNHHRRRVISDSTDSNSNGSSRDEQQHAHQYTVTMEAGDVRLSDTNNPYLHSGTILRSRTSPYVSHVSFESHQDLLQQHYEIASVSSHTSGGGLTVSKAIARGGNLNKAAQYLVVRFGMFPLLHRHVHTLSTGEIRKTLLIRALADRPHVLVLDNAFDGLDVASRNELKSIVSKTIMGFRPELLVQAVSASNTQHTQVVLMTHRPEEIVDEIRTVSVWEKRQPQKRSNDDNKWGSMTSKMITSQDHPYQLATFPRLGKSSHQLLLTALGLNEEEYHSELQHDPWADSSLFDLPTTVEINDFWHRNHRARDQQTLVTSGKESDILVDAKCLYLRRRFGGSTTEQETNVHVDEDGYATLLHNLDWTVRQGERWLVAGANGSGKSTLSRLLAKVEDYDHDVAGAQRGTLVIHAVENETKQTTKRKRRPGIGWVSTELHMERCHSLETVHEILVEGSLKQDDKEKDVETARTVLMWLGLIERSDSDADLLTFLSRPFSTLSQGEQKIVLIAAAFAHCPRLVVMDEPCQALDWIHRRRVLGLMERIGKATDMTLVYITHHMEELVPCVTKVLHLKNGKAVYNGDRATYNPDAL